MKMISSVGQPVSAARKLRQAQVPLGAILQPVEILVGARRHTTANLRQHGNFHIPFCSAVINAFGTPLLTCDSKAAHTGDVQIPDDRANNIEVPDLNLLGDLDGNAIFHGFALVSRPTSTPNRIIFNRIICAEILDLEGIEHGGESGFEHEQDLLHAVTAFTLKRADRDSAVAGLLDRRHAWTGFGPRKLAASPAAVFRVAGRPVITIQPRAEMFPLGEPGTIPVSREILQKIPRRFFERPGFNSLPQEVLLN